jgi:hypothetical protein
MWYSSGGGGGGGESLWNQKGDRREILKYIFCKQHVCPNVIGIFFFQILLKVYFTSYFYLFVCFCWVFYKKLLLKT